MDIIINRGLDPLHEVIALAIIFIPAAIIGIVVYLKERK